MNDRGAGDHRPTVLGLVRGRARRGEPGEQLERVFDELGGFATSPACFGCMFQLAAADFPDPEHPANRVALAHKRSVIDRLRGLAARAGSPDPDVLASQLLLLMDGAFVASRMFRSASPAAHVGGAAPRSSTRPRAVWTARRGR